MVSVRPILLAFLIVLADAIASSQTFQVIHSFTGIDGSLPYAAPAFDSHGNLFGTTFYGGIGDGVVYELQPNGDGTWSERVIHNFVITDGEGPVAGVSFDRQGNVYGTTAGNMYGFGAVYELTPGPGGAWKETVLHVFSGGSDGENSQGGLALDDRGHVYGDAADAGAHSGGTVFELDQITIGQWQFQVDYAFSGSDGAAPICTLLRDANGNLYGTTVYGGRYGGGNVFELVNEGGGMWTEKTLHDFTGGADGFRPNSGLIADAQGNLYGTTPGGGMGSGDGVVYKLTPNPNGTWTEIVLYSFQGYPNDGQAPVAPVVMDAAGNLYGTTNAGGDENMGTVYKLTPSNGGQWTETILHVFDSGTNGQYPYGGVVLDGSGNLYGTTLQNGHGGYRDGVVYEITP